jgi:hypothetical protein
MWESTRVTDKVLTEILNELREIKKDLRWFRDREERKAQAESEAFENRWRLFGQAKRE